MPVKNAIKYISFLLVFTLLAVGCTYVCIQRSLGQRLFTPKIDETYEEPVKEAGIDLNGYYDQNHLEYSEVVETVGERNFTYPQIDGLKNGEVEAAVNEAIAAKARELKGYYGEGRLNYMTYHVYADFSNVLSMGFFIGSVDSEYHNEYLTFNLNDGSLLQLEDLFGVQADLLSMVRGAFYETLTTSNLQDLYWETPQSPDESELYRVVTAYMSDENKKFFLTPSEIYFCYGYDYTAHIDMTAHAEDITVYHKYLSEESLFERDDIGHKGIFTCVDIPEGYAVREMGFAAENFWYDFGFGGLYLAADVPEGYEEGLNAYVDARLEEMRGSIEAIRLEAEANPDTMYIFMAEPSFQPHARMDYDGDGWGYSAFSKAVAYSGHTKLYTMPKALFAGKYRELMVETYRADPYYVLYEGIDHVVEADVQRQRDDSEALYRWDTGEKITVDNLFVEGYDHFGRIRSYVIDELVQYHGVNVGDAELMTEGLWYELEGNGLTVHIPDWSSDQWLWMSLDYFPPSRLTIFE